MNQKKYAYEPEFLDLLRDVAQAGEAVGIAAAAVNKQGEVIYQNFYGLRDKQALLELNQDTIFGLASISKSFTALAILKMEEAGLLSLEDPVSRYLPEFHGFHHGEPVRIRHFLSHAGGYFPLRRTCVGEVAEKLKLREEVDGDLALHAGLAEAGCRIVAEQMDAQNPLLCAPGERMSYCNDGFGLLSEIIRRYGDSDSFADYLKKHILEPLGMNRSCADFTTPATDENAAVLYSEREGVKYADHDYHRSAFVLGGGGAMKSTLSDMCRYLTFLLNEGLIPIASSTPEQSRLLSRHRFREMTRPRVENGPLGWYGYGLSCKRIGGHLVWGHGGSLPGVSSHIAWCPEQEIGVVILCNTEDVSVSVLADGLLRMLTGESPRVPRTDWKPYPWSLQQWQEAAGSYAMDEGEAFVLKVNEQGAGELWQHEVQREMFPIGADSICVRGRFSDSYLQLVRDEDNKVYAARYGSRVYPKK